MKKLIRPKLLLVCFSILIMSAISTSPALAQRAATTYYVSSANGSDNNDGLTETTALATLQYAADQTAPGDTVLVMNGTYTAPQTVLYISQSGEPDAWQNPSYFGAAQLRRQNDMTFLPLLYQLTSDGPQ